MPSALCFFRNNCPYSKIAKVKLEELGFEIESVVSSYRGEVLPKEIHNWSGDYIFCFRSYYILPETLLNKARIAAINFHPGPPEYPCSGCVNFALYEDASEFGVTAHLMVEKVDEGRILEVVRFPIESDDTVKTLLKKTHQRLLEIFTNVVTRISKNQELDINQINTKAEIRWSPRKLSVKDIDDKSCIALDVSKKELERLVRAFHTPEYPLKLKIHNYVFNLDL